MIMGTEVKVITRFMFQCRLNFQRHFIYRTLDSWPWSRQINPMYEELTTESSEWLRSFKAFSPKSQKAFDAGAFDTLRTACDLMNLYFLIDHYTDMVDITLDALRSPEKQRPEGEVILGQATKEFWSLALHWASETSARQFTERFSEWLESLVIQAAGRDQNRLRTISDYFAIRRKNIGFIPSSCVAIWDLEIPDHVFSHEVIMEMTYQIVDIVIIDNVATDDDLFNLVTVAMHQFETDYTGAVTWITAYHADMQLKFRQNLSKIPSFGPAIDEPLNEYILHLCNWPRANDCWNFECGRYFGTKGLEIQQTRLVPLFPKVKRDHAAREENMVVPIIDEFFVE
ncbi:terpenoid synthase [Mycena floridula]|nr:terpenoid synthase [Mycena floridula]